MYLELIELMTVVTAPVVSRIFRNLKTFPIIINTESGCAT